MAQLVGSTIAGYFAAAFASLGVKTLALRSVPPSPGMSTKRTSAEPVARGAAGGVPPAAWAAGARPKAAPATRAADAAPTVVVRRALRGCPTGHSLLVQAK